MNINKDLVIKMAGIGMTLAGTLLTAMSDQRETKKVVEKLVNEQLKK